MATFQLTDGSLGRLAKRTKGLISLLVFAVVYASLSMSPDESMVSPTHGLEVRSDELSQRFLREKGDSPDNVSTPTVANEEEEDAPKRAIFLMSFGASASKSTLVERCVLSMRRRGDFNGPVVILTDAPVERYEDAFDKNVFVINNKEEDMKSGYFSAGEY